MEIVLTGADPNQYNRLIASGDVELQAGALLNVKLDYAPALDTEFLILDNQGGDAVSGNFLGRAEGDRFYLEYDGRDYQFEITYQGGAGGNDVLLTVVPEPGALVLLLAGGIAFLLMRRRAGGK